MTNLESLEEFNEIVKPYLKKNPDCDLFDLLFWCDSWCKNKSGITLLERQDSFALDTIRNYIEKESNKNF